MGVFFWASIDTQSKARRRNGSHRRIVEDQGEGQIDARQLGFEGWSPQESEGGNG